MAYKQTFWTFVDATERDAHGTPQAIHTGDLCSLNNGTLFVWTGAAWIAAGGGGGSATRLPQPGLATNGLQWLIDFANTTSWEPNQSSAWFDVINAQEGLAVNTTFADGRLNFNGTTAKVTFDPVGDAVAQNFLTGGTWMCWMRVETLGGSNGRPYDCFENSNNHVTFVGDLSGSNLRLYFIHAFTGGQRQFRTTNLELTQNEWVHCAIVYSAATAFTTPIIYIDKVPVGVSVQIAGSGTPLTDGTDAQVIGNRPDNARGFDGDIQNMGFWDLEFTAEMVELAYDLQVDQFYPVAPDPLVFTAIKTANFTGEAGDNILFNPSSGTFTLTFPLVPVTNQQIGIKNTTDSGLAITVAGNGKNLEAPNDPGNLASSVQASGPGAGVIWQYDGTQWLIV